MFCYQKAELTAHACIIIARPSLLFTRVAELNCVQLRCHTHISVQDSSGPLERLHLLIQCCCFGEASKVLLVSSLTCGCTTKPKRIHSVTLHLLQLINTLAAVFPGAEEKMPPACTKQDQQLHGSIIVWRQSKTWSCKFGASGGRCSEARE